VRRTSRPGLLRPLRERDFRLLWSGQTVSLLGDGVFTVALAWQTLQLSPHASALGLVLFARALPRALLLRPRSQPPRAAGNLLAEIRQGLAYTRAHAWLWGSILVFSAVNFLVAMAFGALLPLLVRDHLHAGATTLGLVLAAFGAGGGLAAVLAGQFGTPRRRITTLYVSFGVASLLTGGLGLAPTAAVVMALAAGAGFLFEVGNLV